MTSQLRTRVTAGPRIDVKMDLAPTTVLTGAEHLAWSLSFSDKSSNGISLHKNWYNEHRLIVLHDSAKLELQLSNQSRDEHFDVSNTKITPEPPIDTEAWPLDLHIHQASWNEPLGSGSEIGVEAGWPNDCMHSQLQQTLIQPGDATEAVFRYGVSTTETLNPTGLSHLMELDLVHPLMPMVHRGQYFAWSKLDDIPSVQRCLQWAIRALAASMSSQFRSRSDEFYNKARHLADELDAEHLILPYTDISIQLVQTWLLLAHYELLDPSRYPQSETIQRAFRFVQLARLHCTDRLDPSPGFHPCGPGTSQSALLPFASVEERRRTFWVAFCLDRFLGGHEESMMRIHEQTIHVHLPSPEWNFQTSSEVSMGFMNDVLIGGAPVPASSPFAKLVIAMSLFGQCVIHKQLGVQHTTSDQDSLAFWIRHEWLAQAIDRQVALLSLRPTDMDYDPVQLITSMAVYSSVLILNNAINVAHPVVHSQQPVGNDYAKTAYNAAINMAALSESTTGTTCFKTHLYLPMLLGKALLYFAAHGEPAQSRHATVKLMAYLESLKEINGQARQFVDGLELLDKVI
ncbi:hypothetical protein LB506_012794 [Fusarium annulatum]|nr:hypothetical protein LB506_012794 [Fusarium annulatum]